MLIAGTPGATGGGDEWRYELLEVLRRNASAARDQVVVRALITNLSHIAGTVGDGRDLHLEDARGIRFPPLYKLTVRERQARGLPDGFDQAVPDEPIETCWAYELPREARALRFLLPATPREAGALRRPLDRAELPLNDV
jgi:hypothetical protein